MNDDEKTKILESMENLVSLCKTRQYSRNAVEIIGTLCCSTRAYECGFSEIEMFNIATDLIKKYNEQEALSKLTDILV